jgi:hypothetical protein
MSHTPSRTVTPSRDALYSALFHARVANLHATAVQLHNILLTYSPTWNIPADRVLQLAHSSPELASYPAVPTPSTPFQQRSLQLLFYLLTYYEQCFTSRLSSDDAARWHPMRYELCLMAAGVKPCCLVWLGPGYHSSNRAGHLQDRRLVDTWVVDVWQRTVQKLQNVSNAEPGPLIGLMRMPGAYVIVNSIAELASFCSNRPDHRRRRDRASSRSYQMALLHRPCPDLQLASAAPSPCIGPLGFPST